MAAQVLCEARDSLLPWYRGMNFDALAKVRGRQGRGAQVGSQMGMSLKVSDHSLPLGTATTTRSPE